MEPHSVETWMEIFGRLPSPTTETVEQSIASRILGDMVGYSHKFEGGVNGKRARSRDVVELANAIQAYARMVQDAGVKV